MDCINSWVTKSQGNLHFTSLRLGPHPGSATYQLCDK